MSSRPTSAESRLPLSQITNDTIFRVSKKVNGKWENFYIQEGDEAAWVLSQVISPPASLQLQSKWTETDTNKVSYIQDKKHILSGTFSSISSALSTGIDLGIYSHVLITDFQTIYDQPDFDNTGAPKTPVTKTSVTVEPLLIPLLDSHTLQPNAYSSLFPLDQIRYDITFTQTEVNASPAKGRISERIDHLNNRTDYDHRTILFKRYESAPASGVFNQYKDNGGASQEFLTFQFASETPSTGYSNNNYMGNYAVLFLIYGNPFILSNNIFGINTEQNKFPDYFINNTFGQGAFQNILTGGNVINSIFGNTFTNNTINGIGNCIFGNNFALNFFEANIGNVVFGNNVTNNIGAYMNNCTFGNSCVNNDFGIFIDSLIFTNGLQNNNFYNTASGVDFSLATHVYNPYHCSIFYNAASVLRLSYFDAADIQVVVNANA